MADSKDKLRPGITETRGASSSPLSNPMVLVGIVVVILVLCVWQKDKLKKLLK